MYCSLLRQHDRIDSKEDKQVRADLNMLAPTIAYGTDVTTLIARSRLLQSVYSSLPSCTGRCAINGHLGPDR